MLHLWDKTRQAGDVEITFVQVYATVSCMSRNLILRSGVCVRNIRVLVLGVIAIENPYILNTGSICMHKHSKLIRLRKNL